MQLAFISLSNVFVFDGFMCSSLNLVVSTSSSVFFCQCLHHNLSIEIQIVNPISLLELDVYHMKPKQLVWSFQSCLKTSSRV